MKIEQIFEKFLTGDRRRWYDSRRKGAARMPDRTYLAIDLKSFYASVECAARGLDPLKTNLVVADEERTEKTICLAVSPPLKAYGIGGRARLFEVNERVRQVNAERRQRAPGRTLTGSSCDADALAAQPELALDFIIARPRMALYMQVSTQIYRIYLKYIAPEDIHVYSIDEVFIDVTPYRSLYGQDAQALARTMILDVLRTTGITATAGIGTNLYLAKIAMDIGAKHAPPDENGVRIAALDERSYRQTLWSHRPLTDFWRVGRGYARKLEAKGLYTMGDIARCSLGGPDEFYNEDLLYRMFGVQAELLIDHAWGWEPCTIADIKAYRPQSHSLSSGQVLQEPYVFDKARLVLLEMADALALDLVGKGLVTDQLVLSVGYDRESLTRPELRGAYHGPVTTDPYGRPVPKAAHGSQRLGAHTASTRQLLRAAGELFDRIVDRRLLVRRMYLVAEHVLPEQDAQPAEEFCQLSLFSDDPETQPAQPPEEAARERSMQQTLLAIREKYGKDAVLKAMSLQDGATARTRFHQIGGHRA